MSARAGSADRALLFAATFLRALATGLVGVLLGVYLAALGLDAAVIGVVVGAGLAGGAVAALAVTLVGDRLPRRVWLVALAVLGAAGAAVLAAASQAGVVAVAAFAGMVNGMGRDRGAALVIEQAALPGTTDDAHRTRAFAWYNVLQDVGHALGGLLAAAPAVLRSLGASDELSALRLTMGLPALLSLASVALYACLSPAVDAAASLPRVVEPDPARKRRKVASRPPAAPPRLTPESRHVVKRISALFALDSLGGGFLATTLVAYFLHERFGVGAGALGPLFFLARIANAFSHLAAAWLAQRIGLVNTMVFTHVPSSLLLVTLPYAPSFGVAAGLFLLREALVEMDVPTRQSYVMAVVRPEERTVASGVTSLVRLAGWAVAPSFAGVLMQTVAIATPLWIGAGLKIAYDFLLYGAFRRLRPPEERERHERH